jgi:hypothetical protein
VIDRSLLGSDLLVLLDELPTPAVAAAPITGLPAPALTRATFRVRLADGTRLKARRMDTAHDAIRVFELARRFDERGFPRPIAVHGAALLEPWIDGRVARADAPVDVLHRCGQLLGGVHALADRRNDTAERWAPEGWTPERRLTDLARRLDVLADGGHLSRRRADRLIGAAREGRPAAASTGVIHRDLWPRNVVVDATGSAWIVDNGNVGYGAYAFDLARTEYLWPMTAAQRTAFHRGYDETGPPRAPESSFWLIDVLSDAALFRIASGVRGASRPLRRLHEIAA